MENLQKSRAQIEALISEFRNYINNQSGQNADWDSWYVHRFSLLDLQGAEKVSNTSDINALIEEYMTKFKTKKATRQAVFKFSINALDESEVKQYLADHQLDPGEYIRNAGNRSYVLMHPDWYILLYPDLRPDDEAVRSRLEELTKNPPLQNSKFINKNDTTTRGGHPWDISSADRIMTHSEKDSFICYHDESRTTVNWSETLSLLNKYARNYFYSKRLIKSALLRIINRHTPADISFYSELGPDEIANRLLQSEPILNPKLVNYNKLKGLVRKINQPLAAVMQRCQSLIENIEENKDHGTKFLQLYLAGLVSFTTGSLREHIMKVIRTKQGIGNEINWKALRNEVIEIEQNDSTLIPSVELTFQQDALTTGNSFLLNVQTERDAEEEKVRKMNLQSFNEPKPIFVSNEKSPTVYFQKDNKSYQVSLQNLETPLQKEVLENGKPYSRNYEAIIRELTREIETVQIPDGRYDRAVSKQTFDQGRKEELLRKISTPEENAYTNTAPTVENRVGTEKNKIEERIRNENQGIDLDAPLYTRQGRIRENQPLPDKVVGVNYYNSYDQRDTSTGRENFSNTRNLKERSSDKAYTRSRDYADQNENRERYRENGKEKRESRYDKYKNDMRSLSSEKSNNDSSSRYKSGYVSQDRYNRYSRENSYSKDESRNRYNRNRSLSNRRSDSSYRRKSNDNNYRYGNGSMPRNDYRLNNRRESKERFPRRTDYSRNRQEYNNRNRSYSRGRNSGDRNYRRNISRDHSYERRDSPRKRDYRNSRRDSRSYSPRYRNSRYNTNVRDSRSRDGYRDSRSYSRGTQDRYSRKEYANRGYDRNRSTSRSFSPYNSRTSGNNRDMMNERRGGNRQNSRDKGRENKSQTYAMCVYQDMKPYENCREDYNPYQDKICSKCLSNDHLEFKCTLYNSYNPNLCTYCHRGHHYPKECKTRSESDTILANLLKNEEFKNIIEKNE